MAEPNPAEIGEVTTLWVGDLVSAPTCRVSSCPARQPPIFLFQPGFLAKRRVGSNVDAASDARGRSLPRPPRKLGIREPRSLVHLFPGFRVEKRALTSQSSPNRRYRATGWRSRIFTPASRTSVRTSPKHVFVIFFVFCARHVGSSRRIPRPVPCSRTRGRAREIVRGDRTGGSRGAPASRARSPPGFAPFPTTKIRPS